MRIILAKDYENAGHKIANFISAQVLIKPQATIGLATGSTPLSAYQDMVKRNHDGELSFSQVTTINLDEYFGLDPNHEQSYHHYMHENFLDLIDIDPKNTHLPNGLATDLKAESKRYDAVIRQAGQIDIQLLGIGENGHIGFNEPGEHIINNTHAVDLSESTIKANRRFFKREEDVPRRALTMGIGTILRAKRIVMMITGENKAEALMKTVCGPITPWVPASLLRLHSDFVIVADREALSLIEGKVHVENGHD